MSVEAPFPEDSRELIYTVIRSNWKELKKLLGYWFPTGFTLFSLGKTNFDQEKYFFKENKDFMMILILQEKDISVDNL